jgi:hypothetical protein
MTKIVYCPNHKTFHIYDDLNSFDFNELKNRWKMIEIDSKFFSLMKKIHSDGKYGNFSLKKTLTKKEKILKEELEKILFVEAL